MAPDVKESSDKQEKIQNLFDQVLRRHMERLIGTSYGIGTLPMNSSNISCIILLMERENEIESFSSTPPERYTHEALINELCDLGFDLDQDTNTITHDMIQKGYIHVDENGRLIPEKPTVSMARLLDGVFPEMPGMNLVAYFVQTMDEVKSERKNLNSAVNQFDQMLQIQGVPLNKERPQPELKKMSSHFEERATNLQKLDEPLKDEQRGIQKEGLKKSDIFARPKTKIWSKESRVSPPGPKILSTNAYARTVEIKEGDFIKPFSEEDKPKETTSSKSVTTESSEPDPDEQDLHEEAVFKKTTKEEEDVTSSLKAPLQAQEFTATEQESDLFANAVENEAEVNSALQKESWVTEEEKDEPDISPEKKDFDITDDVVERRVAAFEEDLALVCPLCMTSKVKAKETATGKYYYKCSNKNCNFISWGKPYHIHCPQCNNPFLVEASSRDGKSILKCPRATCRHRQKPPWELRDNPQEIIKATAISGKPRKKVVKRRRRVRKKRK